MGLLEIAVIATLAFALMATEVTAAEANSSVIRDSSSGSSSAEAIPSISMYSTSNRNYLAGIRTTTKSINMCVGVLVAPQYVLTAHCEPNEQFKGATRLAPGVEKPSTDYQYVSLGPHYDSSSSAVETIKIESWMRHPNYNEKTEENNYYLFKLATASKMTPVMIEPGSGAYVADDTEVTVLSWPDTDHTPISTTMWIVNQDECKQYIRIFTSTVCTVAYGSMDACKMNNGSPLITTINGLDILIGVMNYNNGCGTRYPTVFNRVWKAQPWIRSVTGI